MKNYKILIFIILLQSIIIFSQTINITWYYNENSIFSIDDLTKTSVVGTIEIISSPGFYMYVLPKTDNPKVSVEKILIGLKEISMNPNYPTKVGFSLFGFGWGIIAGNLRLKFNFPNYDPSINVINVTLDFYFIPMRFIDF